MIGFVVIVILYAAIGVLAATGAISISRKILAPKAEQILYAMFLIVVALFYLAFASYFQETTAWRIETLVVLGFVAIGCILVWSAAQVITAIKVKMLYVEPEQSAARRGG